MKRTILLAGALFLMVACTSQSDLSISEIRSVRTNQHTVFHATTEGTVSPTTKVYADDQLRVLWNADDRITIFNKSTYNSQFCFTGEDGDNAGGFDEIAPSGFVSGNTLGQIYAVYPYANGNKINNDGNTITLNLPSEQRYKEHSFGIGANTMVAVTDNNFLAFKNLGGYLQLRLYGDNVKVSNIKIQGNNGEKIAGKANVAVGLGILPTVTMDNTATDAITLVCNPPVQLGTTAGQYTDFWLVIPPTTFSTGFTITVTDELGGVFQKTTTKSLTITRSTIEWMAALEVTPNYDNAYVVFEDANFKAYCVENFDKDNDGEISRQEALLVTSMTVNPEVVASLKGIEYFTNLQSLDCRLQCNGFSVSGTKKHFYRNGVEIFSLLSSLDLSGNIALTSLDCWGNQLTSLDVSNNTALTSLECGFNQLASLDVSHNTELITLLCNSNQLSILDVAHNTSLLSLYCDNNKLKSLDVSTNVVLKTLWCHINRLTSLDVSNNTELMELSCGANQLTSLDVSNNTSLIKLSCDSNQLASLDVSHNTVLNDLRCYRNQLMSLDVSQNTALTYLYCFYNQLSSLDVSNNNALRYLSCANNPNLTEIWLKVGQSISEFSYDANVSTIKYREDLESEFITFIDYEFKDYCVSQFDLNHDGEISKAEALLVTTIDINCWRIESLSDIRFFRNLTHLSCYGGSLTSLDVSENTALTHLSCNYIQLTSLDVSKNTALTYLNCTNNQLTSLDLSKNTALTYLYCGYNQLVSLDVSNNTSLNSLYCWNNPLTSLDVSGNTMLETLYCRSTQLTSLDVRDNQELTVLYCDSNPNLTEIWLRTGQLISALVYDINVASIIYMGEAVNGVITKLVRNIDRYTNYYAVPDNNIYKYTDIVLSTEIMGPRVLLHYDSTPRRVSVSTSDETNFLLSSDPIPWFNPAPTNRLTFAPTQLDSILVFNSIKDFFSLVASEDEASVPYLKFISSVSVGVFKVDSIRADKIVFSGIKMKRTNSYFNNRGIERFATYDNKGVMDPDYPVSASDYVDPFSNVIDLFNHYVHGTPLPLPFYSDSD